MSAIVTVFHPSGAMVTIPLGHAAFGKMIEEINEILAAGFLVAAPALEAGEEKETVAYVVRGRQVKDGRTTPFLLLYSANAAYKHSFLKKYLNTVDDIADFEAVSGVRLESIPVYIGKDKPEKGSGDPDLDRLIVPVRPFGVVYKANPKWTQEAADAAKAANEIYGVPRRIFVRWEGSTGEALKQAPSVATSDIDSIRRKWKEFLAVDHPASEFNAYLRDNYDEVPIGMRKNLDVAIQSDAEQAGWGWDEQSGLYFSGKTVGQLHDDSVPF